MMQKGLEGITVSLRFLLPIMGIAYFYAYQGDMHSIKDSIQEIKSSQAQNISDVKGSQQVIWKTLNDFKDSTNDKFLTLYSRIH